MQVTGGTADQIDVDRLPELSPVANRLFKVPAGDLVDLGQAGSRVLEPAREPLVQLGAHRLGEAVVGGVADQQVAEAESVAAERRRVGADQLLADQSGQARLVRGREWLIDQSAHRQTVEDLPFDRPTLEQLVLADAKSL